MNMYLVGALFAILSMIKLGPWIGLILLGIWGLLCTLYKKIEYSVRIKKTEPPHGENKKGFFCGKIVAENELKSIYDNVDCIARLISIQPMSSNFLPPIESIELGNKIGIDIDGAIIPIEAIDKITGHNVYMMPTEIDSEEGKKYGILQMRNIKNYMVIESILKNNDKVLVNGYVNENGKICASEIVGLSDNIVQRRFLISKTIAWFSLLLISLGVFMLVTF